MDLRSIVTTFAALLLLAACNGAPPLPGTHPSAAAGNGVTVVSTLLTFQRDSSDGVLRSATGASLETALMQLRRDPPGLLVLQAYGTAIAAKELIDVIEKTAIADLSLVELLPAITTGPERVEVEATYYQYHLADCGSDLAYRKLNYVARTSPGFGCTVEQNRLLSLAYPEEWYQGRRLARAPSGRDAAAVSRYFNQPPRTMPASGK